MLKIAKSSLPPARVIEISNPFEPWKDTRITELKRNIRLNTWLRNRFPGFKKFAKPTIIILNGQPLMQKDWDRVIRRGDTVNIVRLAGAPVVALWIIAVAVVVGVVVALNIKIKAPVQGQTPEADPVYSLKGQRNQTRLGMPIESAYGRVRMWPSYAAQPYNEYKNNQQWLYQLFCLGQGEYAIEGIFIEDTPAENFTDVEFEVCPPGTPVTLFPDNVVTSSEVANLELFGTNEAAGNATWIEDSPGNGLDPEDPDYIAPTGHYGYTDATAFVANPAGTQTNKIQLDVSFPRGLYTQQNDGQLGNATIQALFEARLIDNTGLPLGDWFTIANLNKTMATNTPQRFTLEAEVDAGRYEVRAARTNSKGTGNQIADTLQWESLKAFLPSATDYGDVTMLAMKARASNNLNDQSANRVNVVGVRKLRTWTGSAWTARVPTRNIVWAFCDIMQANYGGRLADTFLELADLKTKADFWAAREDWFDWIFEQRITVWDAAKLAALVGRAIPMPNGSRFGLVRDGPQTARSAIFNQETIVKGSFRREIKLAQLDDYDGLEVTYTDPITWKEETVLCLVDGDTGDNPEKITLSGCTSRLMAWRWGMWKREITRKRREQVIFRTGLEGHIPSYGDLIGVTHDIPRWGQGGFVTAIAEDNKTLTLSEPVTFGADTHKIQLRKKNGAASDVYVCTAGADDLHVVLAVELDPADYAFAATKEPPIFTFGPEALYNKDCVVSGLDPAQDDTVEITATPYRSEPHSHDEETPAPGGNSNGNVPGTPALPSVTGLIVVKSPNMPNEVVATWNATAGARYYIVQLSYDSGTSWETVSSFVEGTSIRFTVLPKQLWVRVCAVTTGAGPFTYWIGQAPVEDTNIVINENIVPDEITDVDLTAGFGMIWLAWKDPANVPTKKLKGIHVYVTQGSATGWDTQPEVPTYMVPPGQQFFADSGLADNVRRNYWFEAETLFGVFSNPVGPYSATTVNGITLDHLIPGGITPPELVSTLPSTGNFKGRLVFLTADQTIGSTLYKGGKLYRWVGGGTYSSPVTGTTFWTAEVETVDLTGQIVSGQIADAAVLNAKLADNAISQAKLQDNIVSNAKLVDGAVDAVKLASAAVTAAKIAAAAVEASAIASGAVTSAKIAVAAVEAAAVAAGAITETKIASDAVTTAKIAAGSITAAKIGAGEVTAGKIAAGAVTATEIAAGAITAAKIGAGEVTAGKIAAGAVTAGTIAAGVVTASEIQAGAVTTAKIAAGAITTTELAAGAVTAAKIGAGEITTSKLAAGAVTANELAANSVIAAKIGAGEVVAGKIAANAVGTNELAANSITAGKIAAGAIVAAAIGTNEIIANTANIKDGVVTNAKIANLDASKINAGTLNAMNLTAAKTASDSVVFNPAHGTGSTFPIIAYQNAQEPSSPMTGFSGSPTDFWMITYWGWATGSGFAQDRFGKSTMTFVCLENGGCTPTVGGWIDLEIIYRVNGGTAYQVNPYAVRAIAGNGSLNINGTIELSGLSSTDTVEFGIRIKANNGSDQWNVGNLTVLAFNL